MGIQLLIMFEFLHNLKIMTFLVFYLFLNDFIQIESDTFSSRETLNT